SIYDRALGSSEIQAIYSAGSHGKCGPKFFSISPSSGERAQTNIPIAVVGQNTHFEPGQTEVDFGPAIAVDSTTVLDAAHLAVSVSIAADAIPGPRTVTLTTGPEVLQLIDG